MWRANSLAQRALRSSGCMVVTLICLPALRPDWRSGASTIGFLKGISQVFLLAACKY
jgi:hypothetical protein